MIQLAAIFQNGLVLQANKPIRIFGLADGDCEVTFLDRTVPAVCRNGRWLAEFPPAPYGIGHTLTVRHAEETLTLRNICIGEVFLCAGQSNMQFYLHESTTPAADLPDDPCLRTYVCNRVMAFDDFTPADGWISAERDTVGRWSALPYLIGAEARRAGIPAVGVVSCSQGASYIQAWMDERAYVGTPLELPVEIMHLDARWPEFAAFNRPGVLYHAMLEPLFPFSFGHVVWYQGESNTSDAEVPIYLDLLSVMIDNWRAGFCNPDLPFTLIQIADYSERDDDAWRGIQRAQAKAPAHIRRVQTVPCADICEKDNIHPPTKDALARRVWAAMARTI